MPHRPGARRRGQRHRPGGLVAELAAAWGDVAGDPAAWAAKAVEAGADLIALRLRGAHPEFGDAGGRRSACARSKRCSAPCGVPLIVYGPGVADKDNEVLVAVAEATKGERLALGLCEDKNYRTIVAAALGNGHVVVALSPIDVNLAKQLNILISDMGLPLDRVLMDPNTGALGYGIEYTYSVMERLRLAALMGDAMTQQPMICNLGEEAWRQKEARAGDGVPDAWGALAAARRGLGGRDRADRARGRRRHRSCCATRRRVAAVRDALDDLTGAGEPRRRHERSLSHGPDRTADLQAPAADQLQGVRLPTCLAFAMKLAQKGAELDACPYVSDEAQAALDAASAPPIRLVTVGAGERALRGRQRGGAVPPREDLLPPAGPGRAADAATTASSPTLAARVAGYEVERVGMKLRSTASRSTTPAAGRRRTRRR